MHHSLRTLLATRLTGVLLVGLGTPACVGLAVLMFEPEGLTNVWSQRAGGPFALIFGLLATWLSALGEHGRWVTMSPGVIAATAGLLLLGRPRRALRLIPRRLLS